MCCEVKIYHRWKLNNVTVRLQSSSKSRETSFARLVLRCDPFYCSLYALHPHLINWLELKRVLYKLLEYFILIFKSVGQERKARSWLSKPSMLFVSRLVENIRELERRLVMWNYMQVYARSTRGPHPFSFLLLLPPLSSSFFFLFCFHFHFPTLSIVLPRDATTFQFSTPFHRGLQLVEGAQEDLGTAGKRIFTH